MITQLTGNGRVLLTVNENGDWNELFYPFPGQFQQLRESRLGLFEVTGSSFTWLRRGNGFEIQQTPYGIWWISNPFPRRSHVNFEFGTS